MYQKTLTECLPYLLQYSVLVRDVHSAELAKRAPMQHTAVRDVITV